MFENSCYDDTQTGQNKHLELCNRIFDVLYHDKARLGLFTKLSAVLIHRAFLIRKKMNNNVAITSIGDILCEMVRSLKT